MPIVHTYIKLRCGYNVQGFESDCRVCVQNRKYTYKFRLSRIGHKNPGEERDKSNMAVGEEIL